MHIYEKRDDYGSLFADHYKPLLPKKAYNQFARALSKPADDFWNVVLKPNLFLDSVGRAIEWTLLETEEAIRFLREDLDMTRLSDELTERPGYIGLSASKYIEGRSQSSTLAHIDIWDPFSTMWRDERGSISFFTNYLRFGQDGDATWNSPSLRAMAGPSTVITIELDPPSDWDQEKSIDLLVQQMEWLRRSGSSRRSTRIAELERWLSQFSDYRGLVVNYSGNKSLHFHFIFDTSSIALEHSFLLDRVRPAHQAAWDRLADAFCEILDPGAEPDQALRNPEQYRRLPNGVAFMGEGKQHLFGLSPGSAVPQVTLYENLISQAPKGADRRLFSAFEFEQLSERSVQQTNNIKQKSSSLGPWCSEAERIFCEEKLDALIQKFNGADGYPKLAELVFEGGIKARLYADEYDKSPNVMIFEGRCCSVVVGGRQPKQHVRLPLTLHYYLSKFRRDWRRQNGAVCLEKASCEDNARQRTECVSERQYGELSKDDARSDFGRRLEDQLKERSVILAHGPTGLGKTTVAMKKLPKVAKALQRLSIGGTEERSNDYRVRLAVRQVSAVATASYDQASDKCEQFNAMHSGTAVGLVFQSFDRLYEQALEDIYGDTKNHKITSRTAADLNYRSVIRAIEARQQDVWQRMQEAHSEMLLPLKRAPDDQAVVLFTVHDVLHQWTEGGLSRLFSHPDFFETEPETLWTLQDATELVVAVHDELDPSHLLELEPIENVLWCEGLFASGGPWIEEYLNLSEALASWSAYNQEQAGTVPFEQVLAIYRAGLSSSNNVGVGPIEPYGTYAESGRSWGLYEGQHKHRYAYRRRSWWNGLAQKTILLTTELLPTEMFSVANSGRSDAVILDASDLIESGGRIEAHVLASLKSSDNESVAEALREMLDLPDMHVICNNGGALEEHRTLTKAKGANDLANEDVLHIANFIPPAQYSELQAINAVFGLNQAIRLWHIDQINQAAGRNLGYRYTGQRHLLVLQSSLWEILEDDLKAFLRLPLDLVETSQKRRDRRHSRERALVDRLAAEALDAEQRQLADPEWAAAAIAALDKRIDLEADKLFGQEEISLRGVTLA